MTSCDVNAKLDFIVIYSAYEIPRSSVKARILRACSGKLEKSARNSKRSGCNPVAETNSSLALAGRSYARVLASITLCCVFQYN
jgi:hypothetical protein